MLPGFRTRRRRRSRLARNLRRVWRIGLLLLAIDIFYLVHIWPDWTRFGAVPPVKSRFMERYEARRHSDPTLPPLQWQPVPASWIPPHVKRAVIVAEDARFYQHRGFDLLALREAMSSNLENRRFRYGGSTLSQQLVKNMFFTPSRNPLRKWHELVLTVGMEMNLSKARILTSYLNHAEFGTGIYGVQAAARHYWGKGIYRVNRQQAAELAATLPSPRQHNPRSRSRVFLQRVRRIRRRM